MAALNGAFALDEWNDRSVRVSQQLHLDVTRPDEPALEIHRGIAERRGRLGPRRSDGSKEIRRFSHGSHPFAAAACDSLDEKRITELPSESADLVISRAVGDRIFGSRHDGHTGAARRGPSGGLAAHERDGFG